MQYTSKYQSPLGEILLAADETGLTGLWFEGQKYFALYLDKDHKEKDLPIFREAKRWLDIYFSGREPDFKLPLHFTGSPFQNAVWEILYSIPYGKTVTYGEIARILAQKRDCLVCRPKRSEVLWDTMRYQLLFLVIGLSEHLAVLRGMLGELIRK